MTTDLSQAGQSALAEALRLWSLDVYDPAPSDASAKGLFCKHTIESLIAACGWTWALPYLGHDHAASGVLEWCGLFAGACWVKAGLDPKLAKVWFPSTYRLDAYASYQPIDGHDNPKGDGTRRIVRLGEHSTELDLSFAPEAGDILCIGPPTGPAYGQHITLVESFDAANKTFSVVSGNGVGMGPTGKTMWGIVKSQVPLGGAAWHARRLIRPAASDLIG